MIYTNINMGNDFDVDKRYMIQTKMINSCMFTNIIEQNTLSKAMQRPVFSNVQKL